MIRKIMASVGRGVAVGTALAALTAAMAFGGVLTVSKNRDANADAGMYTTIQAAVNAATTGDIIEIQDAEVYEEQVTIDSTKHGITLRSKNPTSLAKPVIKYRDTQNTSPKSAAEAAKPGDGPGTSGNFETNGALRIKRAMGVTIDGITVDGGGAFVFGANGVWEKKPPCGGTAAGLFHGNAAITVVVAGGTVIRNCEMRNAYIGVNVKDRNTGGIFANKNPGDNDVTVPLSGFGKTGNHLFEHNRVHDNAVGFFVESSWDLGSTIRYNLIYNNYFTDAVRKLVEAVNVEKDNQQPCAILYKDCYISPLAIYNNTFYNNYANFIGNWKIGGQHLIFNNIFGPSSGASTGNSTTNYTYMIVDHKFPYRMKNSVMASVDRGRLQAQCQADNICADNPNSPYNPPYCYIQDAVISNSFANATKTKVTLNSCNGGSPNGQTQPYEMPLPGAIIPGAQGNGGNFADDANIRWLEMAGGKVSNQNGTSSITLPNLFQSLVETSPNFLEPKWDEPLVIEFIKNKGWKEAGIRNPDGSMADLGAIPSSSKKRHDIVARIKPTDVVRVSGKSATASFSFNIEGGDLTNPKIKYIKWIYQIPNNGGDSCSNNASWANDLVVVPEKAINDVTVPATIIKNGNNNFTFAIPDVGNITGTDQRYGFFELTIEGTDKNGNTITSDVGFLPFRTLEYSLDIKFYKNGSLVTSVTAGDVVTMSVTPMKGTTAYPNKLDEIEFTLLSNPGVALMWTNETTPFINVKDQTGKKEYTVFFKTAGDEIVSGAGISTAGGSTLPFLGVAELKVGPGPADHVVFVEPVPLSRLGVPPGPAPVINRGVDKEVRVEVQDKYNNPVDAEVPVTIAVDKPEIGDIAVKEVRTNKATGIATFIARVTGGKTNEYFDMTASIKDGTADDDVGRLRLGRSLDRLTVVYDDAEIDGNKVSIDPSKYEISGNVNDWFKVIVAVTVGDSVNTAQGIPKVVSVTPCVDGLIFSATSGGTPATEFPLSNGIATFWISATKEVKDECITVDALTEAGGSLDGGINPGERGNITFIKPSSSIIRSTVYGDGHGRPDSVLIQFAEGGANLTTGAKPDSVTLTWPKGGGVVVLSAKGAMLTNKDDYTLKVDLTGVASRPRGYTSVSRGIVTVFGAEYGVNGDNSFDVVDGIGPVIAVDGDDADGGNPIIKENMDSTKISDEILIKVSEQLRDAKSLNGATLLYVKGPAAPVNEPGAAGGTVLEVTDAYLDGANAYRVTVTGVAGGLKEGDWIRFKPDGGVVDRAKVDGVKEDNPPHEGNRWAQLKLQEVAPSVKDAWYTADPKTGKPDYAYVKFDKTVRISDWFGSDGSVNFGSKSGDAVSVTTAGWAAASNDTLKIDLAVSFKSSQVSVRTSEPMPFTLNYDKSKGTDWEGVTSANVSARDWAAPVLADTVFLRIGDPKDDGTTVDTLEVTFSERPDTAALKLERPITIQTKGGPCDVDHLNFLRISVVNNSRFNKVIYTVDGNELAKCPAYPETGNKVSINEKVEFKDDIGKIQDVPGNLPQPLKVIRELKWTVKVKNNPFRKGVPGRENATVEISPNAPPGVDKVSLDATVMVFDNLGSLVRLETLENQSDKIIWKWDGTNQKGRLVGTGTYLFKALCKVRIINSGGEPEAMPSPPPVTRSIGVVRGKE